jgi:putative spermidine/putrescine transport system ATP-binding protein
MRRWPAARIATAVERVLDIVQLPELADRYPRQLSGGQQQRIALARALVYEPSVVLMDEPLGALDKKLRDRLQLEIKQLHRELGIAVLYVTHDQEEALVMSDRICLMRDGRIEQLGTPDDLYFRPRTVFAADFLGESNLLAGRFVSNDDQLARVELADGTQLTGWSDHRMEPGQPVRVMVRPEALRILREGEAADNHVSAVLRDVVMSGGTTLHLFKTPGGVELSARRLTDGRAGPGVPATRCSWAFLPRKPSSFRKTRRRARKWRHAPCPGQMTGGLLPAVLRGARRACFRWSRRISPLTG